jgi:hypothetical protein
MKVLGKYVLAQLNSPASIEGAIKKLSEMARAFGVTSQHMSEQVVPSIKNADKELLLNDPELIDDLESAVVDLGRLLQRANAILNAIETVVYQTNQK